MIIVDGPDSSGKTTLIRRLEADFGLPLSQHSKLSPEERNDPSYREPDAVRKRTYAAILRAVSGRHEPEIHDRLFFAELVYGHVFRDGPCFQIAEEKHIARMLGALKCPVIFCLPPKYEVVKTVFGHDHMEGVTENVERVYDAYMAIWKAAKMDPDEEYKYRGQARLLPQIHRYDYTNERSKIKVNKVVMEYLAARALRSQGWL